MSGWSVTPLNESVVAELEAMPADIRARFSRIATLIETHGLERMHEPHVKHVRDRLWEMRMIGRDGIARAIYVATSGRRVVIVHVFAKKSQKTPPGVLRLAEQRAREVV